MSVTQLVDQQLAFAKAQLSLVKVAQLSPIQLLSIKQAVIGELFLGLNFYASEISASAVLEPQAFHKLLSTPFAAADFRLEELRGLAGNQASWLFSLITLYNELRTFPHKKATEKNTPVNTALIATSAGSPQAYHWRDISFSQLQQLVDGAEELINRHRAMNAES